MNPPAPTHHCNTSGDVPHRERARQRTATLAVGEPGPRRSLCGPDAREARIATAPAWPEMLRTMQVEQALATLGSPVEQIKRELHAARRSGAGPDRDGRLTLPKNDPPLAFPVRRWHAVCGSGS